MTTIQDALTRLETAEKAMTPGPWGEKCGILKHYCFSMDAAEELGFSLQEIHWKDGHEVPAHADAAGIALARNALPALLQAARALMTVQNSDINHESYCKSTYDYPSHGPCDCGGPAIHRAIDAALTAIVAAVEAVP